MDIPSTKNKAVSFPRGMLTVLFLSLNFRRNRGEVTQVVIFAAVGNRFQIFRITPVGDAHTGDLSLFCHIHSPLFSYKGIIGKLIPGDSAALFHKANDVFCVGIGLRDLV